MRRDTGQASIKDRTERIDDGRCCQTVLLDRDLYGCHETRSAPDFLRNDAEDPIVGTFAAKPEGAVFTDDGIVFNITYRGGDGNDVVIAQGVPEPSTAMLLAGGVSGLLLRRRRAVR